MLPGDAPVAPEVTVVKYNRPDPTVLVIFGAGGDLTWRKLIPAVYNLYDDGWLDERFAVVGVDLKSMDDAGFRDHLRRGVEAAARRPVTDEPWAKFAQHLHFIAGD